MNTQTRSEIIAKFKEEVKNGKILVGVGAGTGITAKSSEAGGADMLIIYNSGRYRMAGRGSLAGLLSYGDANQIVVEMGAEAHPRSCGRLRYRPLPCYGRLPPSAQGTGLQRRAELPDRRSYRRRIPPES